jgi:hypothetical protein
MRCKLLSEKSLDVSLLERMDALKYRIIVQGNVDARWSEWLDRFQISQDQSEDGIPITCFTGQVVDQAALRGVMNHLWDFNLTIISVSKLDDHD